jgi:hypothetical protein
MVDDVPANQPSASGAKAIKLDQVAGIASR